MKLWVPPQQGWHRKSGMGFVVAMLAVVALTAFLMPWRHALASANVVMLYLLVVVGMALVFSRSAAVFSAVLGVLAFDFFFVAPRLSFAVSDVQYLLTFAVMLIVGIVLAGLMADLRQQAEDAELRSTQAQALYELARELAGVSDARQVDAQLQAFVQRVLGGRSELWLARAGGEPVRVHDDLAAVPTEVDMVFATGRSLVLEDLSQVGFRMLLLPLEAPMRRRGVCLITMPQAAFNDSSRQAASMLASLSAIALERLHYVEVAHVATLEMETEKMRSIILSALSHDIRTPLTVMLGLADTLLQSPDLRPAQVRELAAAIRGHAMRLSDLAHKLLDMARLQSGALRLRSEWQSVEEIIGAALAVMGNRLDACRVELALPDDLPLVEFDAVLIERVLCNLFENVLRHAGETAALQISCVAEKNSICIKVADDGPGLPADSEQWLFQPFRRGPLAEQAGTAASGGLGLGLAICRAIARAHGGELDAVSADGGGACFRLRLPRRDPPGIEPEIVEAAGAPA